MKRDLRWLSACLAAALAFGCTTKGDADAEAARLCRQLHAFPEGRRAQCCAAQPGAVPTDECARPLAAALRSKALRAGPGRVDGCVAALGRAYGGCDWVGPFGPEFPTECRGLFEGQRKQGEVCRSSLECRGGLFCAGGGPSDDGRCAPPGQNGALCGTAVDALATYTRQDVERLHPQCTGFCNRHRCESRVAEGSPCHSSAQCGPGARCADLVCVDGPGAAGESCSGGDCASGLRCIRRTCRQPLASGAPCTTDFECQAGCVPSGAEKRCAMRCDLR